MYTSMRGDGIPSVNTGGGFGSFWTDGMIAESLSFNQSRNLREVCTRLHNALTLCSCQSLLEFDGKRMISGGLARRFGLIGDLRPEACFLLFSQVTANAF